MSHLLARFAALFVEPASSRRAHRLAVAAPAPCVGVLASERHVGVVAATVALALARADRAHRALVCAWPPHVAAGGVIAAPGAPGARRLRRTLEARGVVDAAASGRLVRVALPTEPERAIAIAERAVAAAGAPAVLAIAGALAGPARAGSTAAINGWVSGCAAVCDGAGGIPGRAAVCEAALCSERAARVGFEAPPQRGPSATRPNFASI
jgi:hypothetical protein